MNPELERLARALEASGERLEAQAIRAISALYRNLKLADLFALLAVIGEEENVRRRVAGADQLLDAFRQASTQLASPPDELQALLRGAVTSGVQSADAMLAILARSPDFIEAFRTRPDREIEFLRHSADRLIRYWGIERARLAQDVESVLVEALERGEGRQHIEAQLRRRLELSRNRAHVIARNELGNAAAYAMRETQTDSGVTHYIWWTARDDRVRGRPGGRYPNAHPSHWARQGETFAWNAPPEGGHPGQAILCRCAAIPVVVRSA